jgi:hypothetical protein
MFWCLHLQGLYEKIMLTSTLKAGASRSSETSLSTYMTTECHNPDYNLKKHEMFREKKMDNYTFILSALLVLTADTILQDFCCIRLLYLQYIPFLFL